MKKKLLLMLLMMCSFCCVHARYEGTAPVTGGQYYLLNVYQSKFLTTGNTLITDKQGTPTQYTATSATSITVNGTTYTIEASDYGYMLKSGGNALQFSSGVSCIVAAANTPTTIDCAQWMFISTEEYNVMTSKKTFTTCALNVDGMPRSLSLNLIVYNKTFELNPDGKEGPGATAIGAKIRELGYDVIGLSEDFNYHTELMNALNNGGKLYSDAEHRESLSQSNAELTNYTSNKPLFDTDGLGLLVRDAKASFSPNTNEGWNWGKWNEWNGYTDQGADGLIKKGYRYYTITLTDGTAIDLYILHMDAETNAADNAARESQMKQLADAIIASDNKRPIIVMGDTNCRYTRDPLKKKFIDIINADARFTCKDVWVELVCGGYSPALSAPAMMTESWENGVKKEEKSFGFRRGEVVDKVFYINNTESNIRIVAEQFRQDISFINEAGEPLADHRPMVTEFSYHNYDPAIDDVAEDAPAEAIENVYLRNHGTGKFLKSGGYYGTHAVDGEYGLPITITPSANNKYSLTTSGLNVNGGTVDGGIGFPDPYMDSNTASYTILKRNGYNVFAVDSKALAANCGNLNYGPNNSYVQDRDLNASDTYQQWEILTKEDLLREARYATPENPYNLTFMMKCPNFDRNDKNSTGWTTSKDSRVDITLTGLTETATNTANPVAKVKINSKYANYQANSKWSVSQKVSGLPAGDYKITCQGYYCISPDGSGGDPTTNGSTYFTVSGSNSATGQLWYKNDVNGAPAAFSDNDARDAFNNGHYLNERNVTVGSNGELTITVGFNENVGYKRTAEFYFDNFQILYLGDGNAYNVIHEDAVALEGEGSRAIASALAEYPYETVAAAKADGKDDAYINTAIEVLKNAVAMCNKADDATSLLTNADFQSNTTGWTFKVKNNDDTVTDWNAGTVGGALDVWRADFFKESELKQTLTNLPNGTYKVSADFMTWASDYLKGDGSRATDGHSWIGFFGYPAGGDISRTDNIVGDAPTQGQTGTFTRYTFYVNVPNHNLTIGVRNDVTRFYQIKNVKVEMVNTDAYQAEVAKGCIYQDLCWMDHNALEYNLTASKYSAAQNLDVRTGGFVQQPNALIRANVGTIAGDNVIVNDVCDNLVLTDKAPFSNSSAFTATNATYEREMSNTWGTVMLPYAVQSNDDVQYYTLSDVTLGDDGVMTLTRVDEVAAGTPAIFLKKDETTQGVTINGNNVNVVVNGNGEATTGVSSWNLYGTYIRLDFTQEQVNANNYYFISGDKFWKAGAPFGVSPFRAYFMATGTQMAKTFRLVIADDESTSISLVPTEEETPVVYTISGVRLNNTKNLQPGIYIINNKKTIVR